MESWKPVHEGLEVSEGSVTAGTGANRGPYLRKCLGAEKEDVSGHALRW